MMQISTLVQLAILIAGSVITIQLWFLLESPSALKEMENSATSASRIWWLAVSCLLLILNTTLFNFAIFMMERMTPEELKKINWYLDVGIILYMNFVVFRRVCEYRKSFKET